MSIQPYYKNEFEETLATISERKKGADLIFACMTDSHLDDNGDYTAENIRAVDQEVDFSFAVHMGDLLNGTNPRKISGMTMDHDIKKFREAVKSGELYLAQGNHDGFRDEAYKGQIVHDMALDDFWYEHTEYIGSYPNVERVGNAPYYYVDKPEISLRMIFLCTCDYTIDTEQKIFRKRLAISDDQLEWLEHKALDTPRGYSVMVFSHVPPFTRDYDKMDEFVYSVVGGDSGYDKALSIISEYKSSGRDVVGWFFGHIHGDSLNEIMGIQMIGLPSVSAYVPQLWKPFGYFPSPRIRGEVSEDAWDTVIWNRSERKVHLIRFGAGCDRSFNY